MKKLLLSFASLFFLLSTFAQVDLDINAAPLDKREVIQVPNTIGQSVLTDTSDCIIDSIRPLSELNSSSADAYPWLSPDGLSVYFTHGEGLATDSLFVASRLSTEDPFGNVEPISVNSDSSGVFSCWLTNDELEIYYFNRVTDTMTGSSTTLYYANRNTIADPFSSPKYIQLSGITTEFLSGPSLTQDRSQLFLYSSYILMRNTLIFERVSDFHYVLKDTLLSPNGGIVTPGQLSKNDLKYYMLTSDYTSATSKIYFFTRGSSSADFSTATELIGLTDNGDYLNQFSISADESIMVYSQSEFSSWTANDLYLASNSCMLTATEEIPARNNPDELKLYPNPVSSHLYLENNNDFIERIFIYSVDGRIVRALGSFQPNKSIELDISNLPQGIYSGQALIRSGDIKTFKFVVQR